MPPYLWIWDQVWNILWILGIVCTLVKHKTFLLYNNLDHYHLYIGQVFDHIWALFQYRHGILFTVHPIYVRATNINCGNNVNICNGRARCHYLESAWSCPRADSHCRQGSCGDILAVKIKYACQDDSQYCIPNTPFQGCAWTEFSSFTWFLPTWTQLS